MLLLRFNPTHLTRSIGGGARVPHQARSKTRGLRCGLNSGVVKVASTFMLALKGRASYVKTASRNHRDTALRTLRHLSASIQRSNIFLVSRTICSCGIPLPSANSCRDVATSFDKSISLFGFTRYNIQYNVRSVNQAERGHTIHRLICSFNKIGRSV